MIKKQRNSSERSRSKVSLRRRQGVRSLFFLITIVVITASLMPALLFDGVLTGFAAPGDLDPTFGSSGIAASDREESPGLRIWEQDDEKIVGAGGLVYRFTKAGVPDQSFGANGIVTVTGITAGFGLQTFVAKDILTSTEGKLLVGAEAANTDPTVHSVLLQRLLPSGGVDSSFAGGSMTATLSVASVCSTFGSTRKWLMLRGNEGKILIVGSVQPGGVGTTPNVFVARFGDDGMPDATFGQNGMIVTSLAGCAYSAVVQSDGRIVILHWPTPGTSQISRLGSGGAVDSSFGTNGSVSLSPFGASSTHLMVRDGTGRLLTITQSSISTSGPPPRLLMLRFSADGVRDTSFTPLVRLDGSFDSSFGLGVDKFDRVLVGLSGVGLGSPESAVVAFRPDGQVDRAFGTEGTALGPLKFRASWLAVQRDGKPIVAGSYQIQVGTFPPTTLARTAVYRLLAGSAFPAPTPTPYGVFVPLNVKASSTW